MNLMNILVDTGFGSCGPTPETGTCQQIDPLRLKSLEIAREPGFTQFTPKELRQIKNR